MRWEVYWLAQYKLPIENSPRFRYHSPEGEYTAILGGDCKDDDGAIYPGASELCDGRDNDCNGVIDDPNVITYETYYRDADEDTYGDPNDSYYGCKQPVGYVIESSDCDNTNADINPDAEEIYDGIDNNCDGQPDEHCYIAKDLIATGQGSLSAEVRFGLDYYAAAIQIDPNNWSDDDLVHLQLIDGLAGNIDITDPNTFSADHFLTEDIRVASGQTDIAWYVMVEIGEQADPNQRNYYPVLSWDTNNFGCLQVNDKDYVYKLIRGLGDSGRMLVSSMEDTDSYQTSSEDGDTMQYFTILWTELISPPEEPFKQIFPWPGVSPGALGWVGIPFTAGFTGGLPHPLTSGYPPGLSIPSFPGTITGFTYPRRIYPAWTSFVPRFPVTFPTLGIFSPIGSGWNFNYWSGFPQPRLYNTGWFYQY